MRAVAAACLPHQVEVAGTLYWEVVKMARLFTRISYPRAKVLAELVVAYRGQR